MRALPLKPKAATGQDQKVWTCSHVFSQGAQRSCESTMHDRLLFPLT